MGCLVLSSAVFPKATLVAIASQVASSPIPAAQYVRMSDEAQQYSIENQKAAILEYAARHGFAVVKTYADAGKSGVIAKHRTALHELLKDVVNGNAEYKAILVYDVSRWGRFPNSDEAAHYEFLCSSAGIPLHYCAEPFANDGTASSSILKALKRSMAAEFSRELGEKVFRGKVRLVQLGFWVGASAGYGYRRLMVSAEGKRKQILKHGERKSLTTDRVILVPGPRNEVECVRRIFSMVLDGFSRTEIARELNRERY
jgi:DNA invertase Pin-like site-specific DNA recombinase